LSPVVGRMVSSPLDAVETFSTPVLGDAKEVIFFSCKTENENCSYSAAAVRNLPWVRGLVCYRRNFLKLCEKLLGGEDFATWPLATSPPSHFRFYIPNIPAGRYKLL